MSRKSPYLTGVQLQRFKFQKNILDNMPTNITNKLLESTNVDYLTRVGITANTFNPDKFNFMGTFANSINVDYLARVGSISKSYSGMPNLSKLSKSNRLNIGEFGGIAKIISENNKVFSRNLFSDELKNKINEIIELPSKAINDSFSFLRYQYVKNSLFKTKPIIVIQWKPVTLYYKENIANIKTNTIDDDTDAKNNIDQNTPLLLSFFGGALSGNLTNALEPIIQILSNQLLPFLPEEYRPFGFFIIVVAATFENPFLDNNDDSKK